MYKICCWGVAALLASVSSSAAMSLSEAVRLAVATNPKIEAAEANYRASEEVLRQSLGRLFPEVDLLGEYGKQRIDRPEGLGPDVNDVWRNNKSISAEFRQVLFDGFDRANDIYRSRARISASSERILARSEMVALNSIEAYIDVTRLTDLLRYARENVRRHEQLADRIRASFSGGNAPISDLQQAEERIQAAKSLVSQVIISLESAKAKYKNAIGVEAGSLLGVPYPNDLPHSSESAVLFAATHNPRIKASLSEIEASQFEKKQFEGSLYPELSIEGAAIRGENIDGTPGRNNELRGMFVLSWKLFDGGIRSSRVRELNERSMELQAEHDVLLRQVREEIEIAWARFTEGRIQVNAIRKQLEQNTQLVKTYFDEYEAQKRDLLDVLDAESTRFRNRYELSNSESLRLFSAYELLANMGKLLTYFGLDGVETFVEEPFIEEYVNEFGAKIRTTEEAKIRTAAETNVHTVEKPDVRTVEEANVQTVEQLAPIPLIRPVRDVVSRELAPLPQ